MTHKSNRFGRGKAHEAQTKASRKKRRCELRVEQLEGRDCPSAFYDLNVIAQAVPGAALSNISSAAFA